MSMSARPRLPDCAEPLMSEMLRDLPFPRRQLYQIPWATQISCAWLLALHLSLIACSREWLSKGFGVL